MINHALIWLLTALALGVVVLVLNAVLEVLRIGNLKTIMFVRKVRNLLRGIPDDMLLSCTANKVSALAYDRATKREKVVPLYTGVLTWRSGGLLAAKVKRRAGRQMRLRSVVFALVFVPLLVAALWATLFVEWKALIIVAFLVFHQFAPFRLWAYPGLSELVDRD